MLPVPGPKLGLEIRIERTDTPLPESLQQSQPLDAMELDHYLLECQEAVQSVTLDRSLEVSRCQPDQLRIDPLLLQVVPFPPDVSIPLSTPCLVMSPDRTKPPVEVCQGSRPARYAPGNGTIHIRFVIIHGEPSGASDAAQRQHTSWSARYGRNTDR